MKLVIISNMAHYHRDGSVVGHGATARELSSLATLFDEVRHVACLHEEEAPQSALPYTAKNVTLVPVPPAGGGTLRAKLDILRLTPLYIRTMLHELATADAVHVRCPANITMLALPILASRRRPRHRWIKYAGNWRPEGNEPASYRAQRELLERIPRIGEVTINGTWPHQPDHIHSFVNPCLTERELELGRAAATHKQRGGEIRLLFVGHLVSAKNPDVAIAALESLRANGTDATLDVAGEGDAERTLSRQIESLGLKSHVRLHGPLARRELNELYARAHFVVLPSRTEGWPKVLSEGMAYGAIPIATAVGSIPQMLDRFGCGVALPDADPRLFAGAIAAYLENDRRWATEILHATEAARAFSYTEFNRAAGRLLGVHEG